MIRRLTLLVPPILFFGQLILVWAAIALGYFIAPSLTYFTQNKLLLGHDTRAILLISDGYRATSLVALESQPYCLFAGPDHTVYLQQDGWLYQLERGLQPVQSLGANIHDWVTWTENGFIYSDGDALRWVVPQAGRHMTLAQGRFAYHHPTLSPDGEVLAFVSGLHPYISDIMLLSMASRQQRCLAQGWMPNWSPDGTRLLYWDGDNVYYAYDRITDRITPLPLEFLPYMVGFRVVWMADSLHLLHTDPEEGRLALKTLNVETFATGRLSASETHNTLPSISPDGEWVAYSSDRDGAPMLFLLHLPDRKVINTGVPVTWRARRLLWSPDGRYVVFVVNEKRQGRVVRYDLWTGRVLNGITADQYFGDAMWLSEVPPRTQTVLVCR